METKTENKNQTDFSTVGPTIFELWVNRNKVMSYGNSKSK